MDDLIKRLREYAEFETSGRAKAMCYAADALEAANARIAALEAQLAAAKVQEPLATVRDSVAGAELWVLGVQVRTWLGTMYIPRAHELASAINAVPLPSDGWHKDAERYGWLRQQHWNEADMFVVAGSKSQVRLGTDCPSLVRLDEAIDAALAKQQAQEG